MHKEKKYYSTRFSAAVIQEAYDVFLSRLDPSKPVGTPDILGIWCGDEQWGFDPLEEWLAEYPDSHMFLFEHVAQGNRLRIEGYSTRETSGRQAGAGRGTGSLGLLLRGSP